MKFRIGNKVKAIKAVADKAECKGLIGRVVHFHKNSPHMGVEFESSFGGGHSCADHGKHGYCRYGNEDEFIIYTC